MAYIERNRIKTGEFWGQGKNGVRPRYSYKGFAENAERKYIDGKLNRYHNKYSHQQSNIHYQETVGNGLISGVARAASEFLYQFPVYTVEDLITRNSGVRPRYS
ncbi:hypothetical protein N9R48_02715 [Rickettsiales bacterium]|nr:hypothetical protein [Rickettsiales bacterium]